MLYDFKCTQCGCVQDMILSISDSDKEYPCNKCGRISSRRTFIASNWCGQMVLKGEWPGKLIKESNYRNKQSEELKVKQRKRYSKPTLTPNVNGEFVDSWDDAKKLACDKGYATDQYDHKVNNLVKEH